MQVFDMIIIGGGPAGLSAAIYGSRYNRSVLVINRGIGRMDSHEINENYLGFPHGIPSRKLYDLGQQQAERFGAVFTADEITDIRRDNKIFHIVGKRGSYTGKTVILAIGVTDILPVFKDSKEYLGRSLFWCITCDGYKTRGKRIVIIGKDDHTAIVAKQFLNFTHDIVYISNCKKNEITLGSRQQKALKQAHIPVYRGNITKVNGKNGMVTSIVVDKNQEIPTDFIFSEQGSTPNNILAKKLGVKLNKEGFIITDIEQRTNIPFVYAAGDITEQFAHQVVAAAYEGAAAGIAANYDLYTPEQKNLKK